ncbi:MAG TPA: hypothetical protein VF992_08450 [Thermoplasmata archaeon]
MRDRGPRGTEIWGIWLVLDARVLALVSQVMYFPVWTADGSSMRTLLYSVPVQPLQYVLARVGWTAAIIGVVGAFLIERSRADRSGRSAWTRERLAIIVAIGADAIFFGTFGIMSISIALWFLVLAATSIIVLIAAGLYLLWTAERLAGVIVKMLGSVAIALAVVADALNLWTFGRFFGLLGGDPFRRIDPSVSVAGALLGAGSLTLWILIYSLVVLRARMATPAVPPVAEA